jgi:serine phosphatase RsbU (regulator of sigma subunit)
VSDRLLGIRPILAVAGLLGLVAAVALYRVGLGTQIPDFPIGEAEIVERARAFAASQRIDIGSSYAIAHTIRKQREVLGARLGSQQARRASLAGEIPVPLWTVRFRREILTSDTREDPGGLLLTLSETGEVLSAEIHEPNPEAPAPPREQASLIARERLAALGVDLSGYTDRSEAPRGEEHGEERRKRVIVISAGDTAPEQENAGGEQRDARAPGGETEQRFVWSRATPTRPEMRSLVTATVTNAGLTKFARDAEFEDVGERPSMVLEIIEDIFFGFLVVLLYPALVGIAVFRLVARDFVKRRRAFVVASLFAVACMLHAAVITTVNDKAILFVPLSLLAALFCAVPIGCAWLAGEADAYFAWGKQTTEGALALLTLKPYARRVARETLEGYLWGWLLLGVLASAAAVIALAAGADAVQQPAELTAADAHPTWLFWVNSIPFVFALAAIGYLFITSWLQRTIKRPWLSLAISSVIVGVLAQGFHIIDLSFGTSPSSLSWSIPFGVAACLLVTRRGLLTAAMATFAFSAFFYGIPLLLVGSTGEHVAGAVGLALVTLAPVLALVAGHRLPEVEVREAPPARLSLMLEQARRQEELSIAHRVQSGLLPARDPDVEGFDVAGTCLPASEIGGDYFDYFKLADGRFGVAVGDVSGKGVPAAFFMTMTKGFMEVAAAEEREPAGVLGQANGHLRDTLARGTFVTMTYAVLDPESRTVSCARAGHNPPVYVPSDAPPEFVASAGTALGAVSRALFDGLLESRRIELKRGDTLVFYTDGVTEAMNADRELFGEERLLTALDRLRDGYTARALVDKLIEEIGDFVRGASQHDDITVVVVKVN